MLSAITNISKLFFVFVLSPANKSLLVKKSQTFLRVFFIMLRFLFHVVRQSYLLIIPRTIFCHRYFQIRLSVGKQAKINKEYYPDWTYKSFGILTMANLYLVRQFLELLTYLQLFAFFFCFFLRNQKLYILKSPSILMNATYSVFIQVYFLPLQKPRLYK